MIAIDFPKQGEVVTVDSYAARIKADSGVVNVEVRVNGTKWIVCHFAAGHWWADLRLACLRNGHHTLIARATLADGTRRYTPHQAFQRKHEPVKPQEDYGNYFDNFVDGEGW